MASHLIGPAKDATHDAMPTLIAKPKTLTEMNRPTRIGVFSAAE
jgi:hypothetical protein